jgi:hypothetical protein
MYCGLHPELRKDRPAAMLPEPLFAMKRREIQVRGLLVPSPRPAASA